LDYEVLWHEKSLRDLKDIDQAKTKQIIGKIKTYLVKDPLAKGMPLKGIFKGLYRFRVGDYRIVYSIDRTENKITIYKVDHRKKVYKSR
jgi:mRNA interferase RelE/StbE